MNTPSRMDGPDVALTPGDVVAIDTGSGVRHVQITHSRAPYPDVVRALHPSPTAATPAEIAGGETAFVAMVELARNLGQEAMTTKVIGTSALPPSCRAFPTFRIPIRNASGDPVYWWTWDGESLALAPEAADMDLPLREVLPFETLRARLAALGAN